MFSLTFSFLLNKLFLKFSSTLGTKNNGDGSVVRWSSTAKPVLGGLSFYILFLLSVSIYFAFFNIGSSVSYSNTFIGLLLSMAVGFLVGLADDAYNTKPFLKFSAQFACAFILIATGVYIKVFDNFYLNAILTIFWVVGIMNSVNMLDNMDGITSTVSSFIILSVIILILLNRDLNNLHLIISIGVLAALIGFLFFNWNPSKMYMGDTGSQFLGVFLSAFGILYFWNDYYVDLSGNYSLLKKFITVGIAFLLPLVDTTVVVINRLRQGRSPFVGGRDHTTHSLAFLGLTDRQVAIAFGLLSLNSMFLVVIIKYFISQWSGVYELIFASYFFVILGFFFFATNKKIAAEKKIEQYSSTIIEKNLVSSPH